ncbi:hypothetical protein C3743_40430 [Burkholderia contaminans]|uniref:Uncharacterized protein n=1 Tax=Burkholderia contaminans TaxID=488447 RepID=A0A2S5DMC7_9BURK|nr:hypothetical protein WK28_24225 [Burkholderia vietnamiensis]POZ80242.1 hypothetical protein C3743_40430 [Burkholderia contaminans]
MTGRERLIDRGVAVYRVGDVYEVDEHGAQIPEGERAKWFVSVLADSPLAATVRKIPLADTEDEAWELAAHHYEQG